MKRGAKRTWLARETPAAWASRCVIDASVAVKWVLEERDRDHAVGLANKVETGTVVALAPDLLRVEFAGALQSSGVGDAAFVELQMRRIEDTGMEYHPVSADLIVRAVRLAGKYKLRSADAVYAALAEREGCMVVTADVEMARKLAPARLAVRLDALR